MLANFLIGLREGLEASLVVGILVAYLVRLNRRDQLPAVWTGVGIAVVLSAAVGGALSLTATELPEGAEEIFAGITSFVAVAFVTWMVFWMRRAARSLKTELHGRLDTALAMGTSALVATAFVAVAREGLETALFMWSAARATGASAANFVGGALGLAVAVLLGWLLYRRAVKVNLAKFFTWTGASLIVVAAGVLSYGVHELQEAGLIPGDDAKAFDVSGVVAPDSVLGTLVRGIFNLSPVMSWLQVAAWIAYLVPVMYLFFRRSRTVDAPASAPAVDASQAEKVRL